MIKFDKCSIGYDSPLVHSLSLDLKAGEIVSVLGPTGVGKSTILRLIGNVDGQSRRPKVLGGLYEKSEKLKMGFVFQSLDQLFPWKTALDNVIFPYLGHKSHLKKDEAIRRGTRLLNEVGLGDHMNKYPLDLSGGMRQRVAIARAMLDRPQILLMDEPFSSLDAITREKLQDLLIDLQVKYKMTVVFITHDIEEALKISQKVLVIDKKGQCHLLGSNPNQDPVFIRERVKEALK